MAAPAAFGDMLVLFGPLEAPFVIGARGLNAGESTLNLFFVL